MLLSKSIHVGKATHYMLQQLERDIANSNSQFCSEHDRELIIGSYDFPLDTSSSMFNFQ